MKTVIISGGTKGIGRALVNFFHANGFNIITCARNQNDLEQLAKDFPQRCHTFKADLSDKKQTEDFAQFVISKAETIDVLINNTGIFLPGQIHKEEDGTLEKLINTNLYSAYYLTKGLIEKMIKSGSGHIFNICSTASITPYVNGGSYCISKYAMYGMTKVLREEMKPYGIKVTAVLPGATFTSSWDGTDVPQERFIPAEDVAQSVFSAYNLSKSSVVENLLIRPQLGDL